LGVNEAVLVLSGCQCSSSIHWTFDHNKGKAGAFHSMAVCVCICSSCENTIFRFSKKKKWCEIYSCRPILNMRLLLVY